MDDCVILLDVSKYLSVKHVKIIYLKNIVSLVPHSRLTLKGLKLKAEV